MSNSNSAQVNMLKKMREEHTQQSTLEKLIEKETLDKKANSISKPINLDDVYSPYALLSISTSECQPWDFADRSSSEMGDIEELANSIKTNGQQEPALIRKLPKPQGNIKYEVVNFSKLSH